MLKEYAVEPAAIGSSWDNFRYLIELLTFERGRLISRFPKNWEDEVRAAAKVAGVTPIKLLSIVERLKTAGVRGSIVDLNRRYDPAIGNWLANAIAEHQRSLFHAIIALANPVGDKGVVVVDDLNDEHQLIRSAHSWEVQRTGAAIAGAVVPLVRVARDILIVDPFLDWRDVAPAMRYRESLNAIISGLYACGRRNLAVQLHFRTHDSRPPADLVVKDAKKLLNGLLPQTFRLELYEWEERENGEDFHDRYILCDCGGISVGAGFEAVGAYQNARVTLEPYEVSQRLKDRFTVGKSAFNLVGKVIVIAWDGTVTVR